MTQYTPEEIEKRKAASAEKRAEGKRIAAEIRAKDKAIAKKMHENRSKMIFISPVPFVTLATFRVDEDDRLTVFWTVKHPTEKDSFKLAKKYLGRYIEEGRADHFFKISLSAKERVDTSTLEYIIRWNFLLRVASGEIKVPKHLKNQIKKTVSRRVLDGY